MDSRFRIRIKQHLIDTYKKSGAKPDYFPHRCQMDVLLQGVAVYAVDRGEGSYLIVDDTNYKFMGADRTLRHFIVSKIDFDILPNTINNYEVRLYE